jgi:hypothetical protein
MVDILDCSVTSTSHVTSITISEAHNQPSTSAVVNAVDTALDMGDAITIDCGYVGNKPQIFEGWVKNIEKKVPDDTFVITCNDELVKAQDFFIASTTPDTQYTARNISAEDLVQALLNMAQITDYTHDTTYFTFGITRDVEVNLISSYDMCKTIADILAYSIWADSTGTVHFQDRRPYVMDDDTSFKTVSGILNITHRVSVRDLRNRVVVYGAEGISASAEVESPYLPAGFRKSVVVASPWIDSQSMAQAACDYNLDKLNRLTEEISFEVIGDPDLHARQVITISESYTGVSGNWYIFTCEHRWGQGGYTTGMELRK